MSVTNWCMVLWCFISLKYIKIDFLDIYLFHTSIDPAPGFFSVFGPKQTSLMHSSTVLQVFLHKPKYWKKYEKT